MKSLRQLLHKKLLSLTFFAHVHCSSHLITVNWDFVSGKQGIFLSKESEENLLVKLLLALHFSVLQDLLQTPHI